MPVFTNISSRTPEGEWSSCRVCGAVERVEPSPINGDAVCPRCGSYLARLVRRFDDVLGGKPPIDVDARLADLSGGDSLTVVEFVMELEETFGVILDDDELARCKTVADLIRYLTQLRGQ
jgi:acyl carrier protein